MPCHAALQLCDCGCAPICVVARLVRRNTSRASSLRHPAALAAWAIGCPGGCASAVAELTHLGICASPLTVAGLPHCAAWIGGCTSKTCLIYVMPLVIQSLHMCLQGGFLLFRHAGSQVSRLRKEGRLCWLIGRKQGGMRLAHAITPAVIMICTYQSLCAGTEVGVTYWHADCVWGGHLPHPQHHEVKCRKHITSMPSATCWNRRRTTRVCGLCRFRAHTLLPIYAPDSAGTADSIP